MVKVKNVRYKGISMKKSPRHIVVFIDIPDPDNFVLLIVLGMLFPLAKMYVVITGRPVHPNPSKKIKTWKWDANFSEDVLKVNAGRTRNLLKTFKMSAKLYHGGIAPRTPVPHWMHFHEYYRLADIDPVVALHNGQMESLSKLAKELLKLDDRSVAVVVGGPMTGLAQLINLNPDVAKKFSEVHAMFASWGTTELASFDGTSRGKKQFNVDCDPQAAFQVLTGLTCPIYLLPTEVTRVSEIGFQNPKALREIMGNTRAEKAKLILRLYELWYTVTVQKKQKTNPSEMLFIHDMSAGLSLSPELREAIYQFTPIEIDAVPHLAHESQHWGEVLMHPTNRQTNRFAATGLQPNGAEQYLNVLHNLFT